jgi:hypothetical protein
MRMKMFVAAVGVAVASVAVPSAVGAAQGVRLACTA